MFRDIEMEDLASTMFDHKETIQDSKGQGRHGEEVHGHDDIALIAQESSPELTGRVAGTRAPEIAIQSARNVCAFVRQHAIGKAAAHAAFCWGPLLCAITYDAMYRSSTFRDVESEVQKLTVNSRSAPARIILYHPPDEGSNLGIDSWPAKVLWP